MKQGIKFIGVLLGVLVLAFVAFTAGGPFDPEQNRPAPVTGRSHITTHPHTAGVSLSIFHTGTARTVEAMFYSGGSRFRTADLYHTAVLVEHPKGRFLFDSGLGKQADRQFSDMPWWIQQLMKYKATTSARDQLDAGGVAPPKTILLSHLHWDHASGLVDFPGADVWVTKDEYRAANSIQGQYDQGYVASQYRGQDIHWRTLEFRDGPYENFPTSRDWFGDGSVVLVPLPGHTPGGVGMFVTVSSGQRYLFTGDTTWALEGFTHPTEKFWLARDQADANPAQLRQSIVRVRELMQADPKLIVVPAHDARVHKRIGLYPKRVQ